MTETKQNTPQEVDLIELFTNIGNWIGKQFKWFFHILLVIFYFFLRNIVWFILLIIIGALAGFINHRVTRLYYHSEMIGYSHTISNIEVIQNINNWNYASRFTPEELENIKDIGATYLLDLNKDGIWDKIEDIKDIATEDTNILKQRTYGNFCIQIEIYDTTLIPKIRTELLNYLSNNDRVKNRNAIRLQQLNELIPKIQNEINDLDSLKKEEYFSENRPPQVKMGEMLIVGEKETKLYHKDVLDLVKQEQNAQRELFLFKDPYEIILDFSVPATEENGLIKFMVRYIAISLVLGFFLILFYDQKKFVLEQIRKSKER